MTYREVALSQYAERCGFTVSRDGTFSALGYLGTADARAVVPLYDPAYLQKLIEWPNAHAAIAPPELAGVIPDRILVAVAPDPQAAFYQLHAILLAVPGFYWTSFATEIAPDAQVHPRAYIAPTDVRIGRRTVVGPNVTILERTVVGDDVVLWPGCVLGSDGYEPRSIEGRLAIVPHAGAVRIGNRVHIQANSIVDRSLFRGFTDIGEDTKIGSLVNCAHNVSIGRRCRVVDSAMLAGSAVIGDDAWIGPQAMIGTGVTIGAGATVGAQSFVKSDVPPGKRAWGVPARVQP